MSQINQQGLHSWSIEYFGEAVVKLFVDHVG